MQDGRKICCRYNFQCDCKVCSLPPEQLQNNDKVNEKHLVHSIWLEPNWKVRREILGLGNNLEDVYREQPVKALRWDYLILPGWWQRWGKLAVAILRKESDNCFNLGIPRFAKMRLERIEKMGVEMIEILPQVSKFLSFLSTEENDKDLASYFQSTMIMWRPTYMISGIHGLLWALLGSKWEGDCGNFCKQVKINQSCVLILSFYNLVRGTEVAKRIRGKNSLWSKIKW